MKKSHIHFMGIGGSGMSAAALIAKRQGYNVSGCDLLKTTPYLEKVKKEGIQVFVGHDAKHLNNSDILCVTPSVLYQNQKHPEVTVGREKKLLSWQEFMGKFLQKGKKVVSITGTHGKSTITTLAGLVYEKAKLDPTVGVGATVREWGTNYRLGKGQIFINEADEFYANFLHYHPEVIVLSNIEFDHPDYFRDEAHVLETFAKFIKNLYGSKTLIFNQDSHGIKKLFDLLGDKFIGGLSLVGYTLSDKPKIITENSYFGRIVKSDPSGTEFEVSNSLTNFQENLKLKLPGVYNVSNALGVVALALNEKIDVELIRKVFSSFSGPKRRMELIGEAGGVKVYDDYAHHPTAISATLSGLRQMYPKNRIICIVEPHMYSRTKKLLSDYKGVFSDANKVIISPIYRSRDKETFGITGDSIVEVSNHENIKAYKNSRDILEEVVGFSEKGDVLIVMGAGDSYKLARDVLANLK